MAKSSSHTFTAKVVRLDGGIRFHVVPVPEAIANKLKSAGSRRVLATIGGNTFKRGLMNHADSDSYIVLGGNILKTCGLLEGSPVVVTLKPDPEPDALDIPECFQIALEQDAEARARWETFPVGRRRSLLHYVSSAKTEPTQIKRAWELVEKIHAHTLHSDKITSEGVK